MQNPGVHHTAASFNRQEYTPRIELKVAYSVVLRYIFAGFSKLHFLCKIILNNNLTRICLKFMLKFWCNLKRPSLINLDWLFPNKARQAWFIQSFVQVPSKNFTGKYKATECHYDYVKHKLWHLHCVLNSKHSLCNVSWKHHLNKKNLASFPTLINKNNFVGETITRPVYEIWREKKGIQINIWNWHEKNIFHLTLK